MSTEDYCSEETSKTHDVTMPEVVAKTEDAGRSFMATASKILSISSVVGLLIFVFLLPWSSTSLIPGHIAFYAMMLALILSFLTIPLGIIALVIMFFSKKQKDYQCPFVAITISGLVFLLSLMVFPWWIEKTRFGISAERDAGPTLKRFAKAMHDYAENNDGRLPKADKWSDLLLRNGGFIGSDEFHYRGSLDDCDCNIAFNRNLGGLRLEDIPGNVVLLFEANGDLNLNGTQELLDKKRKVSKHSYVVFVDGTIGKYRHARGLVLENKSATDTYYPLRWEP